MVGRTAGNKGPDRFTGVSMVILSGFSAPDQSHRRLVEGLMASQTRGIQAAGSPEH
jgi:hypothetical protein